MHHFGLVDDDDGLEEDELDLELLELEDGREPELESFAGVAAALTVM